MSKRMQLSDRGLLEVRSQLLVAAGSLRAVSIMTENAGMAERLRWIERGLIWWSARIDLAIGTPSLRVAMEVSDEKPPR